MTSTSELTGELKVQTHRSVYTSSLFGYVPGHGLVLAYVLFIVRTNLYTRCRRQNVVELLAKFSRSDIACYR